MRNLRNERGSASTRIACAVLGTISLLLALVVGVAGIAFFFDLGYDFTSNVAASIFFLVSAMLATEGVLMFVLPARIERLEQPREARPQEYGAAGYGAAGTAAADPSPTVGPVPATEGPAPAQGGQPAGGPAPSEPPAASGVAHAPQAAPTETSQMLLRSNDVFATARDIVHAWESHAATSRNLAHLATMLAPLDLAHWDAAPTCSATRLSRTDRYWLRAEAHELAPSDYDRYVAAEAALNADLSLPELAALPNDDPAARAKTDEYFRTFIDQDLREYDFGASLGRAFPEGWSATQPNEWFLRASIVNDAECVRVPFRLLYDLRSNAEAGVAVLDLEIPRPACFAIVESDATLRVARARAYALRISWLLASHALKSVSTLERIEVLCHEHGGADTLLAISFTRVFAKRLASLVRDTGIDGHGFPQDPAIRVRFDEHGWFAPVKPAMTFDSELVSSHAWHVYPELDERELGPRTREVTGAGRVCELGINENGLRAHAADTLIAQWHAISPRNCENMVSTLMDMRDSTNDVSVKEACERAASALLGDTVDPNDDDTLRRIILSDGMLQDATVRASNLMEDEEHADLPAAVAVLREALDPLLSFGFYADDESCVYRYFGSLSERLVFNTRIDDHRREVRLVPDSYYNALGLLASAYTNMGEHQSASEAADEMMRIAPASVDAAMRKVRALENQSRIFEAAELIKRFAALAVTPRDAALAHYRLAYMEWKLGREDLASLCYQRALTWETPLSEQARSELDDLLQSYPKLERKSDDEVARILAGEGIPLGFTAADQSYTLTAATLLVGEHAFRVAQPLLAVLCAAEGDDVFVGIRRSLG